MQCFLSNSLSGAIVQCLHCFPVGSIPSPIQRHGLFLLVASIAQVQDTQKTVWNAMVKIMAESLTLLALWNALACKEDEDHLDLLGSWLTTVKWMCKGSRDHDNLITCQAILQNRFVCFFVWVTCNCLFEYIYISVCVWKSSWTHW